MLITGKVRCPSTYVDETKCVEIHFAKKHIENLPIIKNERANIALIIKEKTYNAGIRHTDNNHYIWISPDCTFEGVQYEKVRD